MPRVALHQTLPLTASFKDKDGNEIAPEGLETKPSWSWTVDREGLATLTVAEDGFHATLDAVAAGIVKVTATLDQGDGEPPVLASLSVHIGEATSGTIEIAGTPVDK